MIKLDTLNELRDDELRAAIEHAQTLLKRRDEEGKAKALHDASALLASAGLSLKDLNGKRKSRAEKVPAYHTGRTYQHPTNKALVWNGKGKKPNWLATLEAEGNRAVELTSAP
jgi:DNA-binding protein H-NS